MNIPRPLLAAFCLATSLHASERPINLLFLMTDQQRWDAMSCAGNSVLKTPNLDRLAREGARFAKFYSACPVCSPARTTILTGRSVSTHKVTNNKEITRTDLPDLVSFDQILLRHGYRGEYHGKYHSPYKLAVDYTQPVRWLNGKNPPPGCKSALSEAEAFKQFLEAGSPKRDLRPGELTSRCGLYIPIPLDDNFGKAKATGGSEGGAYGRLEAQADRSVAAFTAQEGIAALERLKDGPFTLTISLDPPHPPMVVSEPYYSLYPPQTIPVPSSLADPRTNSPYPGKPRGQSEPYRDPANIRQMISIYYGMVAEVDDWIGRILKRLDELGLAGNTLVIFTSDHGEMLGDHGLHSKMVFYEGADHVPLLLRLPGVIPAGTVVNAPAGQIDLFATILDYLGQAGHESEGRSLRPLIEGKDAGASRLAISEWNAAQVPGFMVFDGRWKFMFGQSAEAPSLDALYDLQSDSTEINNLIGTNPEREKYRPDAERMKTLLVHWLEQVKSPSLAAVKARPVIPEHVRPQ